MAAQQSIRDRIRELKFSNCRVRVENVDAQESFSNILVCVIGRISNDRQPARKFVQSFVLAPQLNGFYVLNDISRFLKDDDEDEVSQEQEQAQPAPAPAPVAAAAAPAAPAPAPAQAEAAPVEVAKAEPAPAVEETEKKQPVSQPETAPATQTEAALKDVPAPAAAAPTDSREPKTVDNVAGEVVVEAKLNEEKAEEQKQGEAKKEEKEASPEVKEELKPSTTISEEKTNVSAPPAASAVNVAQEPVPSGVKEPTATPAEDSKAPAPAASPKKPTPTATPAPPTRKTWASVASKSSSGAATPSTSTPPRSAAAAPQQKTPPPSATANNVNTASAPTNAPSPAPSAAAQSPPQFRTQTPPLNSSTSNAVGGEWQTAGSENAGRRHQNPANHQFPHVRGGPVDPEHITHGYLRNIGPNITEEQIREAFSKHGALKNVAVNRPRACGFVQFAEPAGFQACAAANPHVIGSDNIILEPRKMTGNPNNNRRQSQGGRNMGNPRFNKGARHVSGASAPKGRGQPQQQSA